MLFCWKYNFESCNISLRYNADTCLVFSAIPLIASENVLKVCKVSLFKYIQISYLIPQNICNIVSIMVVLYTFIVCLGMKTSWIYYFQDTEFPGVVARPIGEFRSTADYQYQLLRCNVDLLKIIQVGLTFLDENGNPPPGNSTWQFNFKYNLA